MKHTLALFLVLAILTSGSALGGQDVLLSKRAKGFNDDVAFAVNPNTGDLLVVWMRQRSDPFSREIWVSLAKRRTSGKYRKAKARKLLPSGVRNDSLPRVVWIEENGEFFVVWERAGGGRGVLGHAVTAAGKPVGEPVSLATDGRVNSTPVITAGASGGIRVYYASAPLTVDGIGRWKMKLLRLSTEYSVEERMTLSKAKKKTDLLRINDVVDLPAQADQGSGATRSRSGPGESPPDCVVVRTTEIDRLPGSGSNVRVYLKLHLEGVYQKPAILIGNSTAVSDLDLAPRSGETETGVWELLALALEEEVGVLQYALGGPDCKKVLGPRRSPNWGSLASRAAQIELPSSPARNPFRTREDPIVVGVVDGAFGYLLTSETDGQVYEQGFDENLNLLGNQNVVFDHRATLTSMLAGNVSGHSTTGKQPDSVLVWTKDTGKGKRQVRAHFFKLEPVD